MKESRAAALEILMKYEKEGTKLGPLLLDVLGRYDGMDKRDRDLVTLLVEGVEERRLTLDWLIDRVSDRKTDRLRPVIRMILRIGTYQLVFMDRIPDSAAVDECVKLVRRRHMDGLAGFVNGVLRGIIRLRDKGISYPDSETEYSCPSFVASQLRDRFGDEAAEQAMRASVGEQILYLRANAAQITAERLQAVLREEGTDTSLVDDMPYALRVNAGDFVPSESEAFKNGLCSVQDLSSQTAVWDLVKAIKVNIIHSDSVDIKIIDLCAAPGGKSCSLAECLTAEGGEGSRFSIRACDISDSKLVRIEENIKRTGISGIQAEIRDASVSDPSLFESADAVIADLPCSGLGVMGRKVDIKYRATPESIASLCKLQRNILSNAMQYLRPGGLLLYSVCTVTAEETEEQEGYLKEGGLRLLTSRQFLQGRDACDGFYHSIWKKE